MVDTMTDPNPDSARIMASFDALPEWARRLSHEHGATMVKQAMAMVGRDEARVTRLLDAERRRKQEARLRAVVRRESA